MSGEIGAFPVTITMPVASWNRIIDVLARGPWNEVNPLIMAIAQPMRAQVSAIPNGIDHAEAPAAQ